MLISPGQDVKGMGCYFTLGKSWSPSVVSQVSYGLFVGKCSKNKSMIKVIYISRVKQSLVMFML